MESTHPRMIARTGKKSRKVRLGIDFKNANIEVPPFPDAQFDVVLSTLMLHHLPRTVREDGLREIHCVLEPAGRVLVVDFGGTEQQKGLIARFHRRHGHVKPVEFVAWLNTAGLNVIGSGVVGFRDWHFALAASPFGGTGR